MKIAVIQSDNLPYDKAKLSAFIGSAKREGAKVIVLPEYVLNRFFKEIEKMPISFVKNQTTHQLKVLKTLSEVYGVTIIAPLILVKKDEKYKVIAKITNSKVKYYYQQAYIPYSHWNEDKFFSKKEDLPLVFKIDDIKIGVMFGFEIHSTDFWNYFRDKKVDCVVVCSVSTFNSENRWEAILQTFSFLNNYYVVRANRIGKWGEWEFYGGSIAFNPDGEMIAKASNREEILVVEISKERVKEAVKEWRFRNIKL